MTEIKKKLKNAIDQPKRESNAIKDADKKKISKKDLSIRRDSTFLKKNNMLDV
jgi:hypothetical protein